MLCQRSGCDKTFDAASNHDTACQHHPGQPIFHEGLKGWTCCPKRELEFSAFMAIPGCAWSKHSSEKRVVTPVETSAHPELAESVVSSEDAVERYGHAQSDAKKARQVRTEEQERALDVAKTEVDPLLLPDDLSVDVALGDPCLHRGCDGVYKGAESREEECWFHPGKPQFHDMSKGYTCCRRKVLEFDDFLKIEGCTLGSHKFVPPPKDTSVQYRYDFYQSVPQVTVTIYCKKAKKDVSTVTFDKDAVHLHIVGPDGETFDKTLTLYEHIKPEESSFAVMSTKVELRLAKAEPVNWDMLELLA